MDVGNEDDDVRVRGGGNPINRCTSAATKLLGLGHGGAGKWVGWRGVDLRV